uniref:PX domain-containing protein n=1 Tax=Octactis speculum TaxID=3111310 RepID=A0A7S2CKA3_9STRA|mmetsp:Transcript_36269/g.49080  ORF Transcript_36269/g.49080 Transcript_36269/m.49080 type:complete len:394 (+) Transcript_36269:104-1285(+)
MMLSHAVPTSGLRPALCIRVIACDYNDYHTQYVVWIQDVQSGAEWHCSRRFRDFRHLRAVVNSLRPSLDHLEFPMQRPLYDTMATVTTRRYKLEQWLRQIGSLLFSAHLHPASLQIAQHIEDFLGVASRQDSLKLLTVKHRHRLRQSVQVHVFRALSLPILESVLANFITQLRTVALESGTEMLQLMKQFINHLQQCIVEGCGASLHKCLHRNRLLLKARLSSTAPQSDHHEHDYSYAYSEIHSDTKEPDDRIIAAAVRRQVESDIFVPLTGKLYELLGDTLDDQERLLQDNIRAVRVKPQTFFGIPVDHISPSSWGSVVKMLSTMNSHTLPYDKLEALLAVSKEIPQLYSLEHADAKPAHLGADAFLPIFIYVLVNSKVRNKSKFSTWVVCA